jgi:hypothetical protein
MRRPRTLALIAMFLAVLAVLATTGPAAAHPVSPVAAEVLRTSPQEIRPATESGPIDPVTPGGPSTRLLAAIVLGVLGLGLGVEGARRHPRRALVLALVLLLAIFAFENGLHSVHHGFDAKQYGECTIAAASANLSAVSVDGLLEASIVLIAIAPTAEFDPAAPPARLLDPHQGRAPPLASA